MANYNSNKKLFELPNAQKKLETSYNVGAKTFTPPITINSNITSNYGIKTGSTTSTTGSTQPQTISEMIASSANPDLELQKYMYEQGLQNVFSDYQKQIAGLDSARQQDIADAYFVREMSKKYLGEYASNVGIGDVSGNLIDIYGNYAENLTSINQNYENLQAGYEESKIAQERELSQQLLATEVGLNLSEYQQVLVDAQTTLPEMITSGDYGEYGSIEGYVNSLDIPEKYKTELLSWANEQNTLFEQGSFVSIKGDVNQEELARFGLSEQPDIDLTYYTNEDIMSDYAFSRGGNMYGVATEVSELPTSAVESFNYQKGAVLAYKGDYYMYMNDGTFHKMIQVDSAGAKTPSKNGFLDNAIVTNTSVNVNGVAYKNGNTGLMLKDIKGDMLASMGLSSDGKYTLLSDKTFSGDKIMFYNGKYYRATFKNGSIFKMTMLEKA